MTRTRVRPSKLLHAAAALTLLVIAACASGCILLSNTEIKVYYGVNALRTEAGLPPLRPDPQLADIARLHSDDMAERHTIRHEFADGCTVICRLDEQGVPHAWAGENTESNNWDWPDTAEHAILTWRGDAEHLANMMSCHYTRFGAGVTPGTDGRIYYSLVFEGAADC